MVSIAKAAELLGFIDIFANNPHYRDDARASVLTEIMRTTPWQTLAVTLPVTFGAIRAALQEAIDRASNPDVGGEVIPPTPDAIQAPIQDPKEADVRRPTGIKHVTGKVGATKAQPGKAGSRR